MPRVLRRSHGGVLGWPGFPACLSGPSQVLAGRHVQLEAPGTLCPPCSGLYPGTEGAAATPAGMGEGCWGVCWGRREPHLFPEALWAGPEQKVPRKSAQGPPPAGDVGEQFGSLGPGSIGGSSSLLLHARCTHAARTLRSGRQVVLPVSPTPALTCPSTEMSTLPRSLKKGILQLLAHNCKIPHCHGLGFLVSMPSTDADVLAGRRAQGMSHSRQ